MSKRFLSDTSGGVALITGLVIFLLAGFVALAVDYGNAVRARQQMQNALDAALLAVAREISLRGETDEAELQRLGNAYLARFPVAAGTTISGVTIDPDEQTVSGRVELSVSAPFAALVTGVGTVRVTVESAVGVSNPNHLELHFVLDVSDSMNIAATPSEIARLKAITQPYTILKVAEDGSLADGCAFACHFRHHTEFEPPGKTMYDIARENNVLLRTDVVSNAAKAVTRSALSGPQSSHIKIGVFHTSADWEQSLEPSASQSRVESAIDTPSISRLETYWSGHLTSIASRIGPSGSGRSSSDPLKMAIIATDGMMGGRIPKYALDPSLCDALKDNGISLAVVYIEPLHDGSGVYTDWVEPLKPSAEANLRKCPSNATLFFRAEDPSSIELALTSAFERLTAAKVRLTR